MKISKLEYATLAAAFYSPGNYIRERQESEVLAALSAARFMCDRLCITVSDEKDTEPLSELVLENWLDSFADYSTRAENYKAFLCELKKRGLVIA
jgi:hypothetical protein